MAKGNSGHRNSCTCPWCLRAGGTGTKNHAKGCKCAFCGGTPHGRKPPGAKAHRLGCKCAFHGPGGNHAHKSNCHCSWCGGLQHHQEDCPCSVCSKGPSTNTRLEIAMQELLTELGVEFETQKRFGRYQVDIYVPDRQLVIECDGEHWHQDKVKQRKRDRYLRHHGLSVWHFPGNLIQSNPLPKLKRALKTDW